MNKFPFPQIVASACRSFLVPSPDETAESWLARSIILSRGTDAPGFVSLTNFPYARRIVELAKSRKPVHLSLCWAAQSSKTQTMFNVAAYRGRNIPQDTLFAVANQVMATGYSVRRWLPMLHDSPVMREIFPADRRRISGPQQRFLTHNMIWTGSHSDANLRGNPVRDLFGDEIDVWEPDALEDFLQRNKAFAGSFTFVSSTPTTRNGAIWSLLQAGSNERFFVPCLHCGHVQALRWEQVRWPDSCRNDNGAWHLPAVEEHARLHCEKCDGPHTNGQRLDIVQRGQWQATNPNALPNEFSFQLSGLYVHHPKSSLGKLAAKFCRAQNTRSPELLKSFVTNELAEPWEPQLKTDGTALEVVAGDYGPEDAWPDGRWLTSTWDVQQDRREGEVRLWAENGDSRLLWEGIASTWGEVEEVIRRYNVPAHHVGVDSGYTPQVVYDVCARNGWQPLKGEGRGSYLSDDHDPQSGRPIQTIWRESLVAMSDGRHIPLLLWASQSAQDHLAFLLSGKGPSYTAHRQTSERYRDQMRSHAKVERGGRWIWDKVAKRDEAWDVATMGVVMAVRLDILRQM